jgi:hypothetical protein
MDDLQQELETLLDELAVLDRCTEDRDRDAANFSVMTIAKRGTKLAIAEVRELMAQSECSASG